MDGISVNIVKEPGLEEIVHMAHTMSVPDPRLRTSQYILLRPHFSLNGDLLATGQKELTYFLTSHAHPH